MEVKTSQQEGRDFIIIDPSNIFHDETTKVISQTSSTQYSFDDTYETDEEVEYSDSNRVDFVLQHRYSNFILMMKHRKEYPKLYPSTRGIAFGKDQFLWYCDICNQGISMYESHYSCFECSDFDLCSKCHKNHATSHVTSTHPHSNLFIKITEPYHEKQDFVFYGKSSFEENCTVDVVKRAFTKYATWPCIGERSLTNQKIINWITYDWLWKHTEKLSYALQKKLKIEEKEIIGFAGNSCKELVAESVIS